MIRLLYLLIFGYSLAFPATANSVWPKETPLKFYFEDYPPYTYVSDSVVQGRRVDLVNEIALDAGIRIEWSQSNYHRMLRGIAHDNAPFCIAGYSYRKDKTGDAKYSEPFTMSSKPSIAVREGTKVDFEKFAHLADLIRDRAYIGGFIAGADYGEGIRDIIKASKEFHIQFSGSDMDLLKLLSNGRVDYVLADANQVAYANEKGLHPIRFEAVEIEGLYAPRPLYIICTKTVPDQIMIKINAGIRNRNVVGEQRLSRHPPF